MKFVFDNPASKIAKHDVLSSIVFSLMLNKRVDHFAVKNAFDREAATCTITYYREGMYVSNLEILEGRTFDIKAFRNLFRFLLLKTKSEKKRGLYFHFENKKLERIVRKIGAESVRIQFGIGKNVKEPGYYLSNESMEKYLKFDIM